MKPDTKFDKPGKSPFMDMDLIPNMLMKTAIKAVTVFVLIRRRSRTLD
jgi:hypothetical protein